MTGISSKISFVFRESVAGENRYRHFVNPSSSEEPKFEVSFSGEEPLRFIIKPAMDNGSIAIRVATRVNSRPYF